MEKIRLYYRGQSFGDYFVGERPLAVGSNRNCDIVVHDPEVADHHWLVMARAGTVVAYDLARANGERPKELHIPMNQRLALGRDFALTRISEPALSTGERQGPRTERIDFAGGSTTRLSIVVGNGSEAKRVCINGNPIHIGSSPDNDLILSDKAVSARHCRFEPAESGLVIRDLGSRNGTYVNGVRVLTALLSDGAHIRIGRTTLRVAARSENASMNLTGMVAESPGMLEVLAEVQHMAALSWPVLIFGESGTGKEHVARALHKAGPRHYETFVALNAGGLPRELVESELFGHERGSFTGASAIHKGVFEQADRGTLFLDEIGELPLEMQARLLRTVEAGEIRRVGGESNLRTDVRIVCATNRNLRAMVAAGSFRQDLYYRLARFVIEVPPLRTRPEDIRALAVHFLSSIASEVGPRNLTPDAISQLLGYGWPGNVRELFNVLATACASTISSQLETSDIERAFGRVGGARAEVKTATLEALRQALQDHGGNLSATARSLGIARSTLRDRLKRPDAEHENAE
jgi:DNA-binding NtrC family response regulator